MSKYIDLARGSRRVLIPTIALAVFVLSNVPLDAQTPRIAGVVKDAAGKPVTGALIKARSEGTGVGFMVVSREQGRYSTPSLLPGKYTVQAFGGDVQSAPGATIEVSDGSEGRIDLALSVPLRIPPREKRMTDADYEKLMPDGSVGKSYVAGKCIDCHALQWTVSARKTRAKWLDTLNRMYDDLLGHRYPVFLATMEGEPVQGGAGTPDRGKAIGTVERAMLEYLAKYFGPDTPLDPRFAEQLLPYAGGPSHPNRNLPTTLLYGAAAKYVAMEYALPVDSAPSGIAVDSQGIAWISERNTGMIGRYDSNTMTYARIAAPAVKNKPELNSIAVDPQGKIWLVDDGPNARILQYDPKSHGFDSYPIPDYPFEVPDTGGARIATLRFSNGNVWASRLTAHRILKLDPRTRRITEYPVPKGSAPYGLAIGGNHTIWYAAEIGNGVVQLDTQTGKLTPHEVLTPRSDLRGMAADAGGNLWVAATESGKLLKVDSRTGAVTEYSPPTKETGLIAVDVDRKQNLIWFSEIFSDKIGRFDPRSNTFVEFPHPSADSDVRQIQVDPRHPNRVWWSGARPGKIGYIEVFE